MKTVLPIVTILFFGTLLVSAFKNYELPLGRIETCVDHFAVIETVYYQPAAFWVDEEWHYVARKENGETYGMTSHSAKQEGDSVRYKTICTR